MKASLQYCAAFEAEPEEDEYDLLAAGQPEGGRDDAGGDEAGALGRQAGRSHGLQRTMQVSLMPAALWQQIFTSSGSSIHKQFRCFITSCGGSGGMGHRG